MRRRPDRIIVGISIHAPSRERPKLMLTFCCKVIISIHAPSRERLMLMVVLVENLMISIHAPSRERPNSQATAATSATFQSTLPRGIDNTCEITTAIHSISIHAPSRERLLAPCAPGILLGFQSTLPYGSDYYAALDQGGQLHFNPRSLTGATCNLITCHTAISISIHAPLRERPVSVCQLVAQVLFQSTLPCGSDYRRAQRVHTTFISIHAPLRERHALVCI